MPEKKKPKKSEKQEKKSVESPKWLKKSEKDAGKVIEELAKEGKSPADIGRTLRDKHGVPDIRMVSKKNISQIMAEKGFEQKFPPDLNALITHALKIHKHLSTHRKDFDAKRGLQLTESNLRRLAKYYKRKGKIPKDWKYISGLEMEKVVAEITKETAELKEEIIEEALEEAPEGEKK